MSSLHKSAFQKARLNPWLYVPGIAGLLFQLVTFHQYSFSRFPPLFRGAGLVVLGLLLIGLWFQAKLLRDKGSNILVLEGVLGSAIILAPTLGYALTGMQSNAISVLLFSICIAISLFCFGNALLFLSGFNRIVKMLGIIVYGIVSFILFGVVSLLFILN
jgi:hypothetical protein